MDDGGRRGVKELAKFGVNRRGNYINPDRSMASIPQIGPLASDVSTQIEVNSAVSQPNWIPRVITRAVSGEFSEGSLSWSERWLRVSEGRKQSTSTE